ncbi:MAG: hypothetical protein HKN27_01175 [Silicimonas sp.]|nr:hypothetical protein [Silicimonas sp.]
MKSPDDIATIIAEKVAALAPPKVRNLVAIAGPPASGKSTVAEALQKRLQADGVICGLVAMDGYHLDNAILDARGLRARKGAPETFDYAGFASTVRRLGRDAEVITSTFDRVRDLSLNASAVVSPEMKTVIVEGNYLLLDEPPWRDLAAQWTLSVFISADQKVLEERLIDRWLEHGFDREAARAKALENDIPNAIRVLNTSVTSDLKISASISD